MSVGTSDEVSVETNGPAKPGRSGRWGALLTRVSVGVAAGWLVLLAVRPLLGGRVWWWVLVDLLPPLALLLVPAGFLVAEGVVLLRRRGRPTRRHRWLVGLAALGLALAVPQSGVNWRALGPHDRAPADALKVVSWDTLEWHQGNDPDAFYRYLKSSGADVYVLQEYMEIRDGEPVPVDDSARLRAAFPGYHFASAGELLTISRYPITTRTVVRAPLPAPLTSWDDYWNIRALRTDIEADGKEISLYNVHLPDQFSLESSPLSTGFYRIVDDLDHRRRAVLRALQEEIAGNPRPKLVAGEFNVVPGSGELRWLDGLTDGAHSSRSLYPVSFWVGKLQAWRLDWAFSGSGARIDEYRLTDPGALSSHRAQEFRFSG
ncbi:endonuclease/exonuclease/phosphatase family protein [Streptomyces sp. NPDC096040]|uniref:endonuclease/exonuclease/phosphatase family protein n=1 Tax=Streptomyces sp. NPDC096040 TaxID=3155541 RepID=UPI00332958EE